MFLKVPAFTKPCPEKFLCQYIVAVKNIHLKEIYFINTLEEESTKYQRISDHTGRFNAKTSSGQKKFPEQIGNYGKSYMNISGIIS